MKWEAEDYTWVLFIAVMVVLLVFVIVDTIGQYQAIQEVFRLRI